MRIELLPDALGHQHRQVDHGEDGVNLDPVLSKDGHGLADGLGDLELMEGFPAEGVEVGADVLLEGGVVGAVGAGGEAVEELGGAVAVAEGDGDEGVAPGLPELFGDLGDEAEVDEEDAAVAGEHQVAGVHVGVDEAVEEDHLGDAAEARLGEPLAVLADVGGLDAVDELHGDHPVGAQVIVEVGDAHLGLVGEVLREAAVVAGLAAEVELIAEGPGEVLDGAGDGHVPHPREHIDEAGAEGHEQQVALDLGGGLRALDLDGDDAPVVEDAPVHLGHGGGGDGLPADLAEAPPPVPQLGVEGRLDHGEGRRRHRVLEPRQPPDHPVRQQIGPRRQDLTELDEGGAEALQGGGDGLPEEQLALRYRAPPAAKASPGVAKESAQEHEGDVPGAEKEENRPHGSPER